MTANDDKTAYNDKNVRGGFCKASSLVQFRTEESIKTKATDICERLGIDLTTYMRMCISRLVQENGISDMTLDEINAEIAAARE